MALLGTLLILGPPSACAASTHRRITNWWALVFAAAFLHLAADAHQALSLSGDLEFHHRRHPGHACASSLTPFGFILLVSLLGGLGRISKMRVIYGIASLYVEVIRGIPLLVQLLFIWFALPQVFDVIGAAHPTRLPGRLASGSSTCA